MRHEPRLLYSFRTFSPCACEADGIHSTIARLHDVEIQCNEIFDPDYESWDEYGVKMLSVRLSTAIVFDKAAKLPHSVLVQRMLVQRMLSDELALLSLYVALSWRMEKYDQLQCAFNPMR